MTSRLSASAIAATYSAPEPAPDLEPVTLDVLIGMAHGRSYPEIAADHELNLYEVEKQARILRTVLGAADRAEVVGIAYRRRLLPLDVPFSTHPVHTVRAVTMQATLDVLYLASRAFSDDEVREARELARALINSDDRRQVVPELPPMPSLDALLQGTL